MSQFPSEDQEDWKAPEVPCSTEESERIPLATGSKTVSLSVPVALREMTAESPSCFWVMASRPAVLMVGKTSVKR